MASDKQTELFHRLIEDKQFPQGTPEPQVLKDQFSRTSQSEASAWIEKALALPDKGDSGQPIPF